MDIERKPQDGRGRVLSAAQDLYLRHGAANVGINDVIRTAGVARMTLYNHFASKDLLTAAVYSEMADRTLSAIEEAIAGAAGEPSRVDAVMRLFAGTMDGPDFRGCPFIHAALQESEPTGQILALVRSYKLALRDRILWALDENRADRAEVADQIVLLLDGAVTEGYIGALAAPIETASRAAVALLAVKD